MQIRLTAFMVTVLAAIITFHGSATSRPQRDGTPASASQEDRVGIQVELAHLEKKLDSVKGNTRYSDAELFHKAVVWALRYEPALTASDVKLIHHAVERGSQRAEFLLAKQAPWEKKTGRLVRAYVSAVDDSVQPYGLVIPEDYDPKKPIRLDVVLHGSTRPVGMSELRFISQFDTDDGTERERGRGGDTEKGQPGAPDAPSQRPKSKIQNPKYIELHPLGRVENCYRWAGETDVFEAIEDVCRNYNIDRSRIVLRGMSMGASGTWHLGLKHPDFFVALGPYCGYVDTHRFSETPGMNFVKVGSLPEYQEAGLHMLDSVDYAANAGVVPCVAAIGEKDPFFQAHVIMGEAFKREGLEMVNLISPGTAHVQDPKTWAEQMRRIGEYADKGLNKVPKHIRFVSWTLKYSRCHWFEVLGMEKHYDRAEVDATLGNGEGIDITVLKNITRFAIHAPVSAMPKFRIRVTGKHVTVPPRSGEWLPYSMVFEKHLGKWKYIGDLDQNGNVAKFAGEEVKLSGKMPGVQGPIDDAFTKPFLCVRGTGKPWNPTIQTWSEANLKRFSYEWSRYFRGDLRIKDDAAVTESDLQAFNLILFGDPGSNLWIRKALPKLPIGWSRKELRFGKERYSAADHSPALICPSPFGSRDHYIVINSGHTFHEAELNRLNYLLFPRLGDWAVLKVGGTIPANPSDPLQEEVVKAGYFDERWRMPN